MARTTRKGQPWRDFEFTKEQLKYDPDEFLVPAQDSKGHSCRELVRMPPGMERDMEILLESKRFPYRSKSDLLRHAVLRHLKWLSTLEPDFPVHYLVALQMMQTVATDDLYRAEMARTFHELDTRIQSLLNSGEQVEAMRMISRAKGHMESQADTPAKDRLKKAFQDRYGHFLRAGERSPGAGSGSGSGNWVVPPERQLSGTVSPIPREILEAGFVDDEQGD
jgi:hypothetical protein